MNPNQIQWVTVGFMTMTAMSIIGYDLMIWRVFGVEATVSRVWLRAHQAYPVISLVMVFALGVLVGHFFLPQDQLRVNTPTPPPTTTSTTTTTTTSTSTPTSTTPSRQTTTTTSTSTSTSTSPSSQTTTLFFS